MRDKLALMRSCEERLRVQGSSVAEVLDAPHVVAPVPLETGYAGRLYHVIGDFTMVVRSDTKEPITSVPTSVALMTLLKYAPEDAVELAVYMKKSAKNVMTLTRRDVYYPLDADASCPRFLQHYIDDDDAVWTVVRTADGKVAVTKRAEELGRYTTVADADADPELPDIVVDLCEEVLR